MPSSLSHAAALVFASVLSAHVSAAQSSPARDEPAVCLGFSFGPWTPALEWSAAGHGARPDSSQLHHASSGRDWATSGVRGEADSLLILFPSWWPAGISIELPTRSPAPGDTVTGKAHAFVADGRVRIPTSRVRAWRVAC
ncbi:MAG TPA: hypothetical protein VGG84_17810 [Gemmatimonadaceae bacterium]